MRIDDNGIIREMTKEEIEKFQKDFTISVYEKIENLKNELLLTDYKAIKYSEGFYKEEEYKPIKEYRQSLRDEINRLQKEVLK